MRWIQGPTQRLICIYLKSRRFLCDDNRVTAPNIKCPETVNSSKPCLPCALLCHITLQPVLQLSHTNPDRSSSTCLFSPIQDLLQITPCFLCILAMRRTRRKDHRRNLHYAGYPEYQRVDGSLWWYGSLLPTRLHIDVRKLHIHDWYRERVRERTCE